MHIMEITPQIRATVENGQPINAKVVEGLVPLSRATAKAVGELTTLRTEEVNLAPQIEAVLDSDSGSIDSATAKLTALRDRRDIVHSRRLRRRAEVLASIIVDGKAALAKAHTAAVEARAALTDAKATWKDKVRESHRKGAALTLTVDPALWPKSVRYAEATHGTALDVEAAIGVLLYSIDEPQHVARVGTARGAEWAGHIENDPAAYCMKVAARFWPCLAD